MRAFVILLAATALVAQTKPAATKAVAMKAAPAPAKPAVAAKNFKVSGNPAAPLTIEVYTDYECPSCRNLYIQTMPSLQAEYVAKGKVQLIHRDFPLSMHQFSKLAARYANAAGQIGKYDLAVNHIFQTQPQWSQNGNVDAQVAKVLDPADMAKVREMVKTDTRLDDTVTADVAQGTRDNLNQTPTMIFVLKGKRTKVDGFMPFPILKTYIDQQLVKAQS